MQLTSTDIEYCIPLQNEFEISLFGPGVGECIVAHLGDNKWIIVDSCCKPKSKEPIALEYLNQIGVNPSESVVLFIVTHWHSDHIRGASKIVKECTSARFGYPSALLKEEFLKLVSAYSGIPNNRIIDKENSGTIEFAKIVNILFDRCESNPKYKINQLVPIQSDRVLYSSNVTNANVSIRSLSPSDKSYHNSILEFASLLPKQNEMIKVIPSPTKNNNSVVLWIDFNITQALLGSDLEETNDPLTGWTTIINSPVRPHGKASIFKIPHHGSENGHSHDVWGKMVNSSPVSILTSKIGGQNSIPKIPDIERIKKYSSEIYCTKVPIAAKPKRDHTVEKMFKVIAKNRTIIGDKIGHIQIRFSDMSNIKVNYQYPAEKL
ncbi:MAG: MBL fold metallo-hydrolase [Proteobacteria bacterium]|nr:MBL fold metallo-hydrolase [Pseudomonadota bacterium]